MKNLIFILIFISSSLFATTISGHKTRPSKQQVIKDFDAQNFGAYADNFGIIQPQALVDKGIIDDIAKLDNNTTVDSVADVTNLLSCDIGTNAHFSSSIYDINVDTGVVTCITASTFDIMNPFGIFKITYPKVREFFSKDLVTAKSDNEHKIEEAEERFSHILEEKQAIKDSVFGSAEGFMSIPDLLIAVILTDDSKVDVVATRDNNKILLRSGLSSSIISSDGEVQDMNAEYILSDMASIFVNYSKFSDISIYFLWIFAAFIMIFGLVHRGAEHFRTKNKQHENILYGLGIVLSALFFLPTIQDDQIVEGYDTFTNKAQSFEKNGYGLFTAFSDEIAAAIIDTNIDSIIFKSGIGTGDSIINSYAGMKKYEKQLEFSQHFNNSCRNIFDYEGALQEENLNSNYQVIFTDNSSTLFPTSENWAYAQAQYNNKTNYYSFVTHEDNAYSSITRDAYTNISISKPKIGVVYFPQSTLAACGKNYFKNHSYYNKFLAYKKTYESVSTTDGSENSKAEIIKQLVRFQYTLQRDFGFLGILGLPVIEMQTKMVGSVYNDQNTEVIDALKKRITKEDDGSSVFHSLFSTLPYMFVPGAMPVYKTVSKTTEDVFQKGATAALAWVPFAGDSLAAAGGIVGTITAQNAGFAAGYMTAKSVLSILPMIGIILLGLLRFIIIIMKVFVLHFAMLFLFPIAFIREGISAAGRFVIRVFSVMLEFPIFVLSVYLALVANSLVNNIGTLFTKNIAAALIENSDALHTSVEFSVENFIDLNFGLTDTIQIYMIDGFFEVIIALFSLLIIYKLIITTHTLLFESIEMKATSSFDTFVESIKQDSANLGGKI